eukprot:COSAG01_NODE_69170_length_262_cov_0.631902_1_plen_53_part_10
MRECLRACACLCVRGGGSTCRLAEDGNVVPVASKGGNIFLAPLDASTLILYTE